jgi:Lrp/AsnC family leucine-responsive transcriptional regulator
LYPLNIVPISGNIYQEFRTSVDCTEFFSECGIMSKQGFAMLDETNLKILELLQEDCKAGVQKISENVGKGISTVHARVKALEQSKIIKQYTAILDPVSLNRPTLALIFVTIRYRAPGQPDLLSQKEFCKEIAKHPFVQEVFVLSGQYDVFLKVRTKDVEEMNRFIVDFLRELPAVERTLTMFVMDNFLESLELRRLTEEK